jgi:SAM-dependent methyltransferase
VSKPFYDYPALYDAVHLGDTAVECEGVLKAFAALGVAPRTLLEPACGTGRYLQYLSEKGIAAHGYDSNSRLIAFARRRLAGTKGTVEAGSMESYRPARTYDAAFTTIATFRHLPGDRAALAHLKSTAAGIPQGGFYLVGLDLVDYSDCFPDEEGWEIVHRGRALKHLYETIPPTKRSRKEKVINFITVSTRRGERVLQDEYDLRSYDLAQWRALVAKSPFRLTGAFDAAGKPVRLDRSTRYALFALKKR